MKPCRIGLISDTHNYLDPIIPGIFAGVHHIFHGGDVGLPRILHQLEAIAPVTAVLGNTDDPMFGYRLTEVAEVQSLKFLVHHIVNPHNLDDTLRQRIQREQPRLVVFGHTHKPFSEAVGNVHFLNPGYAGKPRFNMPRSVAILECHNREFRVQTIYL